MLQHICVMFCQALVVVVSALKKAKSSIMVRFLKVPFFLFPHKLIFKRKNQGTCSDFFIYTNTNEATINFLPLCDLVQGRHQEKINLLTFVPFPKAKVASPPPPFPPTIEGRGFNIFKMCTVFEKQYKTIKQSKKKIYFFLFYIFFFYMSRLLKRNQYF